MRVGQSVKTLEVLDSLPPSLAPFGANQRAGFDCLMVRPVRERPRCGTGQVGAHGVEYPQVPITFSDFPDVALKVMRIFRRAQIASPDIMPVALESRHRVRTAAVTDQDAHGEIT